MRRRHYVLSGSDAALVRSLLRVRRRYREMARTAPKRHERQWYADSAQAVALWLGELHGAIAS